VAPFFKGTLMVSHPARPIRLCMAHDHKASKMVLTHGPSL
jgi:hypothetical protein